MAGTTTASYKTLDSQYDRIVISPACRFQTQPYANSFTSLRTKTNSKVKFRIYGLSSNSFTVGINLDFLISISFNTSIFTLHESDNFRFYLRFEMVSCLRSKNYCTFCKLNFATKQIIGNGRCFRF